VTFRDLSKLVEDEEPRDWVFSTEVLEHIPKAAESGFVANINRLAKIGVVISCGAIAQWGSHHVNNKEPEEIIKLMEGIGMKLYRPATEVVRRNNIKAHYLATNIMVFRRELPVTRVSPQPVLGLEGLVCAHKGNVDALAALMSSSKWGKFFEARNRCFIPTKWLGHRSCGCGDFFDLVCDGLKDGTVPSAVNDTKLVTKLKATMRCDLPSSAARESAFQQVWNKRKRTWDAHQCWERTFKMCPSDMADYVGNKIEYGKV